MLPLTTAHTTGQSILVIEDDPWIRGFLIDVLTDADYLVVEAHDGRAGVRLIEEHAPDLVLLDIALPELTGLDVLRLMRRARQTSCIPVIVLSAYPSVVSHQEYATDIVVLRKPVDIDVLLETVERALLAAVPGRASCAAGRGR